ncbi:hypothetical protein DRO19_00290 [Candidatus Bathyarchaeota archaeon]|nr:MAG: hypothetical protein DRO19_00290 [Candidatus Bathyarchaeota archaeon]
MLEVKADRMNARFIVELMSRCHDAILQHQYREALEILHRMLDWLSPSQIRKLAPAIIKLECMLEGSRPIDKFQVYEMLGKVMAEIHRRGWLK